MANVITEAVMNLVGKEKKTVSNRMEANELSLRGKIL